MVDTSCELNEKVANGSENSCGVQENSIGVQENSLGAQENSLGVQENSLGAQENSLGVQENSCSAALQISDSQEPSYERKSVLKQVTMAMAMAIYMMNLSMCSLTTWRMRGV